MRVMAVDNQQARLGWILGVCLQQEDLFQPLKSYIVTCPAILREGDLPGRMLSEKLVFEPLILDTFRLEDDERADGDPAG